MSYQNADISKITFPTITKALTYLTKADNPVATERDTRPLFALLERVSQQSRIAGHLLTRKTAVTSFPFRIAPATEADGERAAEAAARVRKAVSKIGRYHTDVAFFGAMLLGVTWDSGPLGMTPRIVRRYRPTEFARVGEDSVALLNDDGKVTTTISREEPNENFLFDVDDLPSVGGIARSIMFFAILAHENVTNWSNFNKRLKGVVAGIIDAEKFQKAADALNWDESKMSEVASTLQSSLKAAGEENYLQTINAVDVQFKKLVEAAAGTSFREFREALNSDIAIALLGQANTSEIAKGSGSRAGLQVLNLIRADIMLEDRDRVRNAANLLLEMDYVKNSGPLTTELPYSFEWIDDEAKDSESAARVYETLSRIPNAPPVSKKDFYTRTGLVPPDPNDKDDTLLLGSADVGSQL